MGYVNGIRGRLTAYQDTITTAEGEIAFRPEVSAVCVDPTYDLDKDEVYYGMCFVKDVNKKLVKVSNFANCTVFVCYNQVSHLRRYKSSRFVYQNQINQNYYDIHNI